MDSRMPACSPAVTRLTNNSLKYSGCLPRASASVPPASTEPLMSMIRSCMLRFSWPRPTISKDCTRGTPEDIMVAICREDAYVLGGDLLFAGAEQGLGFFLDRGWIDALAPQDGLDEIVADAGHLALDLFAVFVQALPEVHVGLLDSRRRRGRFGCRGHTLLHGYRVDLFEAGDAVHHLLERRLANVRDALFFRLIRDLDGVGAFHDQAFHGIR